MKYPDLKYPDFDRICAMLTDAGIAYTIRNLTDWKFPDGWWQIELTGGTIHDGPVTFRFVDGKLAEIRSDL